MTSTVDREATWAKLTGQPLDVLILGGGIVGCGIARDAAMRGLKVGLVDRYDFAYGTSSRSSRLLHGGIRYLEQGRIGLVREASLEKKTIHQIAPHLAAPLGFVFPVYRGQGRPYWQLRIGVKLYDWLCSGRNFAPSRGLSVAQIQELAPNLKSDGLVGAAYYFDAMTNDARLVIDTLKSAENNGATLLNYANYHDAKRESDRWSCQVEDTETSKTWQIQAKAIVNATGPWSDQIPNSDVKLRLSKGIHLVIPHQRLPIKSAVVVAEGKRILFVLPWGDRVILGTTDTDFQGPPENVRATLSDVDYVLQTVNDYFPQTRLNHDDVVSHWAGLRPLIANPDGSPSDISRAHQIIHPKPGWWDIAGGKLTTYRLMAEQLVDKVASDLGIRGTRCRTASEPLVSLDKHAAFSQLTPPAFSQEAVDYYVQHEWARHLDDVLVRRGGWLYYDRLTPEQVRLAADWMGRGLSWTEERRDSEINRAEQYLAYEV
jgi:glycerol-3-phosphate dehydrogenase